MATCPDCGLDHHPHEEAPEIAAAAVIAEGAEGAAEAEAGAGVRIAEIDAEAAVELAKINAKVEAGWQEARVVELEGQVSGMREIIDRLTAPPPEPAAPADPPAPVADDGPPPPDDKPVPPAAPKKSKGWWG
jgi:hypothetical protein